ncbi:uncharacterized protein TNCV_141871 [Trichonephila clavipes]|nr:uncharacterized protein TNCV_141871 [Trichonephila clavipes]
MALVSPCMSGNTCDCRMSWTYRWAVMVPRNNTKGDRILQSMAPHTITPAVLNQDSSLNTTWFHSAAVQFLRAWHHSKRRRRWVSVKGTTRNGRYDLKCPSARRHHMVREDTGAPNEGATCAWMVVDEAVGCTGAFLTMWRASRRLVCRGHHEPGLHINDISRIHWLKKLLTTQSEQLN